MKLVSFVLQFYEPLKLFYGEGKSLELKLTGDAIKPEVTLSPELEEEGGESVLRMGHALVNDTIMRTLQLQNHSSLGVRFGVELESLLPQVMQRRRPNTFSKLADCLMSIGDPHPHITHCIR